MIVLNVKALEKKIKMYNYNYSTYQTKQQLKQSKKEEQRRIKNNM